MYVASCCCATACLKKYASSETCLTRRTPSRTQAANIGGIYVTAVDANQAVRVMLNEMALANANRSAKKTSLRVAQFRRPITSQARKTQRRRRTGAI